MSVFADSASHIRTARREIEFAIGALEMATGPDVGTLGGYTGSQCIKELREALKVVRKAEERLGVLTPA